MSAPSITTDQMLAMLRERALKICQLSLEVNARGLAQAFVDLFGHTNEASAVLRPADACIWDDETPRPELAQVNLRFYDYDFHDQEQKEEDFHEQAAAADRYIAYLELLLAQGRAVTVAAMRGAA